jgi:hypothetical protein
MKVQPTTQPAEVTQAAEAAESASSEGNCTHCGGTGICPYLHCSFCGNGLPGRACAGC